MKLLNYDSKLVQTFRVLSDYMGMNLMFLLCSIPVVTIGSAHVALYTAIRASRRNEPWAALFWKTFITSLKQPTVIWVLSAVLMILFGLNAVNSFSLGVNYMGVLSYICLTIVACVAALCPMFFSRFDCTVKEMVFNSLKMIIAFPLRVIIGTALAWAPMAFYLIPMLQWIILQWLPIFVLLYFSAVSGIYSWMMRKPFGLLTGEEPEKKDSYLVREAKKNLEKFEQELIRQTNAKAAARNAQSDAPETDELDEPETPEENN